jgi:hypothetical protein
MDRPDLFFSGGSTFTDVLVEIAQNTKEISETLKKKRAREETTPERLIVCVREDDGDFTYIYWKPFDAETAMFLGGAKKSDLSERVIAKDNEAAEGWSMTMFDTLPEITCKFHCSVYHFL